MVIADTEIIWNIALAEAITELGHHTTVDDALVSYVGKNWADCVKGIERRIARPLPPGFADRYRSLAGKRFDEELRAVAGAADFIRTLGEKPRCIASSTELHTVRAHLTA